MLSNIFTGVSKLLAALHETGGFTAKLTPSGWQVFDKSDTPFRYFVSYQTLETVAKGESEYHAIVNAARFAQSDLESGIAYLGAWKDSENGHIEVNLNYGFDDICSAAREAQLHNQRFIWDFQTGKDIPVDSYETEPGAAIDYEWLSE